MPSPRKAVSVAIEPWSGGPLSLQHPEARHRLRRASRGVLRFGHAPSSLTALSAPTVPHPLRLRRPLALTLLQGLGRNCASVPEATSIVLPLVLPSAPVPGM